MVPSILPKDKQKKAKELNYGYSSQIIFTFRLVLEELGTP